jgi:hypothetical protein
MDGGVKVAVGMGSGAVGEAIEAPLQAVSVITNSAILITT